MLTIAPTSGGPASPFRLNLLPHDAFVHAEWTRVRQRALVSVASRKHLLLLGMPGTGKSLLLRSLNQTLTDQGATVRQLRSDDTLDDLAGADILLIDEAELLSAAKVERILRLPNALVLVGLPTLPERISTRPESLDCVTLRPLPPEDVAHFVIDRLIRNGRPRDVFTPEALAALVVESGGLLRLVIILAGAALFFAEQRGAATVTVDDVADAAAMRAVFPAKIEPPSPPGNETADAELLSESDPAAPPDRAPAWVMPMPRGTPHWGRAAGLSAFVCASLVVIGVAVMTAREIGAEPVMPIQEVQSRSMPPVAEAAMPDLALSPTIQPEHPMPVQMVAASPILHPDIALPPAPAPKSSSETEPSELPSAVVDPQALAALPPAAIDLAETSTSDLTFTGPILNDTMGQRGQLSLVVRRSDAHGSVAAVFQASHGLIGSGVLTGDIRSDGQMSLSGRLMMGRNPFDCVLAARLEGERLVGVATFVRSASGAAAHSSFKLSRL